MQHDALELNSKTNTKKPEHNTMILVSQRFIH